MTRCGTVLGAGALVALLAGCGGTSAPPAATPGTAAGSSTTSGMAMSENTSCSPSGTALKLMAKDTRFDSDCLAAPAGQAVTLAFDNEDPLPHNVEIFTADPDTDKNAKSLFKGDLVTGPKTVSYAVPALAAANYHFHCDVHPTQMYGTLVVK